MAQPPSIRELFNSLNKDAGFDFLNVIVNDTNSADVTNLFKNGQLNSAAAFRLLSLDYITFIRDNVIRDNVYRTLHNNIIGDDITLYTALQLYTIVQTVKTFVILFNKDKIREKIEMYKWNENKYSVINSTMNNKLQNFQDKTLLEYKFGPSSPSRELLSLAKRQYCNLFVDGVDDELVYKFWFTYNHDVAQYYLTLNMFFKELYEFMLKKYDIMFGEDDYGLSQEEFAMYLLELYTNQNNENKSENKSEKSENKMQVKQYTDKAYVVYGYTKEFKDELKEFGCRWNGNLTKDPFKGWLFPASKINEFKKAFSNKAEFN